MWLTPRQYHCENCGYTGILVMELEEDPEQTESAKENESKEDKEKKETA